MHLRKSDTAFRKLRQPLLWLLCLSLAVWAAPAWAWADDHVKNPVGMHVIVGGGKDQTIAYGQAVSVDLGAEVTLKPDKTGLDYQWTGKGVQSDQPTLTVTPTQVGLKTYGCTVKVKHSTTYNAKVVLDVSNPLTVTVNGTATLQPGGPANFEAVIGPAGYDTKYNYTYDWKILDSSGNAIDSRAYSDFRPDGNRLSFKVNQNEYAYLLYGAKVVCTATVNGNKDLTATGESTSMKVGIVVSPGRYDLPVIWYAAASGDVATASLDLHGVYGGNASADQLSYQWQQSSDGKSGWQNVSGATRSVYDFSTAGSTWSGTTWFQCLVGLQGDVMKGQAISGKFDVVRSQFPLVIDKTIGLDPSNGVVVTGAEGQATATATILTPANKNGKEASNTNYTAAVYARYLKDPVATATKAGALVSGASIDVKFTPLAGEHEYTMTVSSDASAQSVDTGDPFTVILADKNATSVTGSSQPLSGDQGEIVVSADLPITYTLTAKGGTGYWKYAWSEGGMPIANASLSQYTDTVVTQGSGVTATATVMDGDGADARSVPEFEPFTVTFGKPFIPLEWADGPSDQTLYWDAISDDQPVDLFKLSAKGGTREYTFDYTISDATPGSEAQWTSLDDGNFTVKASMLDHDFTDGKTAYFTFWFRATCGTQTLLTPVTLTVVQDPTVLISGKGVSRSGDAWAVSYYQGVPPTLRSEFVGGTQHYPAITYTWVPDDGDSATGSSWTPSKELQASPQPYMVTVKAQSTADRTLLATADVALTVVKAPEVKASAWFVDSATVSGDDPVTLRVAFQKLGTGSYTFDAKRLDNGDSLGAQQGNDSGAVWHFDAPGPDGNYTWHWTATDNSTGLADSGDVTLTVQGGIGPEIAFSIYPPDEATLEKGTSFDMVVHNTGRQDIKPADLTWKSDNDGVATVNGTGEVDIASAGDVTITATLTSDDAVFSDYNITATDESTQYSVDKPSLSYETGSTIDADFTTHPVGGVFSYTSIPDGLQLSSDGHLSGMKDTAGTYTIKGVTVKWRSGHVENLGDVPVVIGDGGGDGDGGDSGGCNGGFGILALALSAFWAFKRQGR